MKLIRKKLLSPALSALALAAFLAFVVFMGGVGPVAEAVIGGIGNVTDTDNPHNFAAGTTGVRATSETEICIFCHTPHRSIQNATLLNPPLWNHDLSTVSSYTVKVSGTVFYNGIGNVILLSAPPDQPDGASKMCLSCHDGTVSVGALASRVTDVQMESACAGSATGLSSGILTDACDAYIGVDLTSKHVVSIPVNAQLRTDSIANCVSVSDVTTRIKFPWEDTGGDDRPDTVLLRPVGSDKTYAGNTGIERVDIPVAAQGKYSDGYYYGVQCSSCHDPHLWASTTSSSAGYKFLVEPFNDLCSACHTTDSCP